jgi:hypothetical protein
MGRYVLRCRDTVCTNYGNFPVANICFKEVAVNTQELRDRYLALRDQLAKSGPTNQYELLKEELAPEFKMFGVRVKFEKAQETLGLGFTPFVGDPLTDQDRENIEAAGQIKRQIDLLEKLYWRRKDSYVGSGKMDASALLRSFEELRDDWLSTGSTNEWEARREELNDELKAQQEKLKVEKLCQETGLVIKSFKIGMPFSDEHRRNIRRAGSLSREVRKLEKS